MNKIPQFVNKIIANKPLINYDNLFVNYLKGVSFSTMIFGTGGAIYYGSDYINKEENVFKNAMNFGIGVGKSSLYSYPTAFISSIMFPVFVPVYLLKKVSSK